MASYSSPSLPDRPSPPEILQPSYDLFFFVSTRIPDATRSANSLTAFSSSSSFSPFSLAPLLSLRSSVRRKRSSKSTSSCEDGRRRVEGAWTRGKAWCDGVDVPELVGDGPSSMEGRRSLNLSERRLQIQNPITKKKETTTTGQKGEIKRGMIEYARIVECLHRAHKLVRLHAELVLLPAPRADRRHPTCFHRLVELRRCLRLLTIETINMF